MGSWQWYLEDEYLARRSICLKLRFDSNPCTFFVSSLALELGSVSRRKVIVRVMALMASDNSACNRRQSSQLPEYLGYTYGKVSGRIIIIKRILWHT